MSPTCSSSAEGWYALTQFYEVPRRNGMLQASSRSEHDTARVASFDAFPVARSYTFASFMHPGEIDRWGRGGLVSTAIHGVSVRRDEQKRERIVAEAGRNRRTRKRILGEGGRKRLVKCEFSAAKETRTAPLLVMGLAAFPKLPPPHPSIYHFTIQSHFFPSASPSVFLQTSPCMFCCFLGFARAWQSMRDGAGWYHCLWQAFVGDWLRKRG